MLDRTEGQRKRNVVDLPARYLSDGRLVAGEEVDFPGDGAGGKETKDGQAPSYLEDGCIFALIAAFAIVGVDWLSILLLGLCGVEEDLAVGVACGQQVALVVVLLVENDALVAVGVVEKRPDCRSLLRHYIKWIRYQ